MAEIRRHYVRIDDLDKQAYQREYINAHMKEGEDLTLYFESMSVIRGKLFEVGVPKTYQEANIHLLQCLTSEYEVDTKIPQYAPNLTIITIEDRVRITCRELEASKMQVILGSHGRR